MSLVNKNDVFIPNTISPLRELADEVNLRPTYRRVYEKCS